MSNEARMPGGVQIRKTSGTVVLLDHRPAFNPYNVDVSAVNGPSPGAVTVTTSGTDIDLSQITEPGLCEIVNRSSDQLVTFGLWDSQNHSFYSFGELNPGEGIAFRFSQDFGERDDGAGTGTTTSSTVTLRFYSTDANAVVYIGAFAR